MEKTQSKAQKLESGMKNLGGKMKSVGGTMTKYVSGPLAAVGTAVGKVGMDFENAMQRSTSIMDDMSDAMRNKMEKTARQVALETDKSAKQAADSYYYLASAGMDAAESMEALPEVAKFATAGQFDMATATDLLTDAQSALGMASEDTEEHMENMKRVSDVLTEAQNMANASTQQFSEALTNRAAAALKSTNKDVEEGTAVLAAFADQGIKGQRAGNTLARMFNYLSQAQNKNEDMWEKYNMDIYDSEGNMKNFADIIAMLEEELAGMSDEQKNTRLTQLGFNAETQKTIKTLMGTSDQIKQYEKDLRNAQGATEEIANKQMQSLKKQLGLLLDGLKDVGLSLYEVVEPALSGVVIPALQKFVGWIQKLADFLGGLPAPIRNAIGVIALLATAIGPVLVVIGTLMTVLAPLAGSLGTIAAIVGAVVAAVSAAVGIWTAWGDEIKRFAGFLVDIFIEPYKDLPRIVKNVWNSILQITRNLLGQLTEYISNNTIADIIRDLWNAVSTASEEIWTGIRDTISNIWKAITQIFTAENIVDTVTGIWIDFKTAIVGAWNSIVNAVSSVNIWQTITSAVVDFARSFKQAFAELPGAIKGYWEEVVNWTAEAWGNIVDFLKESLESVVNWIPDKISGITGQIKDVWNEVYNFFDDFSLYEAGRNIMVSLGDGVRDAVQGAIDSVKNAAQNITDTAKKALGISSPSKVFMEIAGNVGEGMEEGLEDRKKTIAQKAREMSEALINNMQTGDMQAAAVSPVANGGQTINNQRNINNSNFQPSINMQVGSEENATEERRRQEQLLRKLGTEYGAL